MVASGQKEIPFHRSLVDNVDEDSVHLHKLLGELQFHFLVNTSSQLQPHSGKYLLSSSPYGEKNPYTEKNGKPKRNQKQTLFENEYQQHRLNGAENYCLKDQDSVGGNCTWLCEGKRCEKHLWWGQVRTSH